MGQRTIQIRHGERDYTVTVNEGTGATRVRIGERTLLVECEPDGVMRVAGLRDGDQPAPASASALAWTASRGDSRWVFSDGRVFELEVAGTGSGLSRRRGARSGSVAPPTAPMPATVRRIDVSPGQAVRRGDTLIILEAMKMELPVKASANGTVTAINCREGELVQPGVPLLELAEG